MLKAKRLIFAPGVAGCLLAVSLPALGQTTVIETFENYGASSGSVLDPSTVGGSGWSRDGVGASDWDVACCSGVGLFGILIDFSFDSSPTFLAQRRSGGTLPAASDENTDFAIPTIVEGYVSFDVNPAATGGDDFRFALHDSGSGSNAMVIVHTESGWPVINSGDFRVLDGKGGVLAEGTNPNDPDTDNPGPIDRWFKILAVFHGDGTYDVTVFDIGPVTKKVNNVPTVRPYGDPARGISLRLSGAIMGVPSVDTFRLLPGSTNGGGSSTPTVIDNIIASDSAGSSLELIELKNGDEISFPTQAGRVYQAQFSDDAPTGAWSNVGPLLLGDGTTQAAVASLTGALAGREYRVLEF